MKTIGVIGLGSIGMRHANNLLAMGHEVIGHDPSLVRQAELVEIGGYGASLNEFRKFKMDGVVIAAPSSQHVPLLLGFPSMPVLVEKPIGVSGSDCEILGLENLSRVMTATNLRFHDCVERAREWMPSIGTPIWAHFICAQFNDRPDYLRDGVTLNWGAHEVDLALYLLGPATFVGANISRNDDNADILLQHDSGCKTTVHLDYLSTREVRGFSIAGAGGRVACDLITQRVTHGEHKSAYFNLDWNETYIREMQAFVDRIDGKEDKMGATGQDGLDCLKLLLDAKRMTGL